MATPVEWRTVLPYLPQPREAHDAIVGQRKVEVRLWYTPVSDRPYAVTMQFLEGGNPVWQSRSDFPKMIGRARDAYKAAQRTAEAWLQGRFSPKQ